MHESITPQKSESFTQLRRDDEVLSASPIQSDSFDVSEILGRQRTLSQQHSMVGRACILK